MTERDESQQGNPAQPTPHKRVDVPQHYVRIAPESLREFVVANDTNVINGDQMFFLDFSITDPAHALGWVDTQEPLRKNLVARVVMGPNAALQLLMNLGTGLAKTNARLTIILDGEVVVSNDPNVTSASTP